MAQRIKIKRSSSATNPSNLKEGELAYIHSNTTGGNLYIGRPGTGDAQTGIASNADIIGGLIDHNKLSGIAAGAEVNPSQVTAGEITAGSETAERSFSPADVKSMVDTHALTGLSAATSSAFGGIKLHDDTAQTTAPESVSSDANRTYAVQLNASSQASVNVPWSDTVYTLPTATSSALGGIELFSDDVQSTAANTVSTTANRTYGIQLNSDGQAVVNVPWDDTVNTYTGSTGVTVDAANKTIAIGQSVGTTDDVTFDDLTLTGNIQFDDSGEIKFSSEGLAYDESTNTITSTRIIFDEWDYDSYSVNELADIARAITKLSVQAETMPHKYAHLFDYNDSGSFSGADTLAFLSAVEDAVSTTKYQNVTTAITNSSDYATTFIADLKDGDYDVASVSDGSISLGSSSSRFKDINLSGDATIGGDLDVGGTVSIADIVTQSSTAPVIKLKDTTTSGHDFKIAVDGNELEITQHTDLDESGDTSLSLLKAKANAAGDGVLMAIGGNYDGSTALTVTGAVGCTGNLSALGTVILGAAAVAATDDDPAIPAKHTTVKANLTVDGDLTVNGTTTTVDTETIKLADNIIELNSNIGANNASENAGIEVNRGNYTNVQLFWDETNHDWRVDTVGDVNTGATTSPLLTSDNFETNVTELDGGSF